MTVLEATYDSMDDVPEAHRELYSEKGDKVVFTGIANLPTQENVARLEKAMASAAAAEKKAKADLRSWKALGDFDEVAGKIDRFGELEAAAGDKIDDTKIDEIVGKRYDARIAGVKAPLERRIAELETANGELNENNGKLSTDIFGMRAEGEFQAAFGRDGKRVVDSARPEIVLAYRNMLEVRDDGAIVTKDNVGVPPGLSVPQLLDHMAPERSHWFGDTVGGGSRGGRNGKMVAGADNPWSAEGWNMTKQRAYRQEHGEDRAAAAARSAGSEINAVEPPAAKT